jgi:hypothetical protein
MSFRYYEPGMQVGGMLVYEGSRRQRGGNIVGNLKRIFLPLAKTVGRKLGRAGRDLTQRGIKVGVGAITDKLRGDPTMSFKESLKRRAAHAADKAVVDYLGEANQPDIPFLSQDGMGLRKRRRRKKAIKGRKTINKRRKTPTKCKKKTTRRKKAPQRRKIISDIFS